MKPEDQQEGPDLDAEVSKVGREAMALMEDLQEELQLEGAQEVGTIAIVVEVRGVSEEEGEEWTAVRWRCSDPRAWVATGFLREAAEGSMRSRTIE